MYTLSLTLSLGFLLEVHFPSGRGSVLLVKILETDSADEDTFPQEAERDFGEKKEVTIERRSFFNPEKAFWFSTVDGSISAREVY